MLTFNTELDNTDTPVWYSIKGTIIDHDGYTVTVGESTFNFDRAISTLSHYVDSFDNVEVSYTVSISKD